MDKVQEIEIKTSEWKGETKEWINFLIQEYGQRGRALLQARELFLHYHETYCGSEYCDEGCPVTECKFRDIGAYLVKL